MNQPVSTTGPQLRVKRNRYDGLGVPELGRWSPDRVVSVVIPAYGAQDKLDATLAALAAQTYPAHLLDVVVVDDGSTPPLRLPQVRPERTRLIANSPGAWGIASAVDAGVEAAEGEVVLRLDSDVIAEDRHVEAHARWHQDVDYCVVIGNLAFVEIEGIDLDPAKVRAAVEARDPESFFGPQEVGESWEAALLERSDRLLDDELRAYSVTNGATVSFTKALYRRSGGLDTALRLGSDTELGYRQAQAGAVFVPDAAARAWHLGRSQLQSRNEEGKRYRQPFVANRVPTLRYLRAHPGIAWGVPYVEVVVEAGGAAFEAVTASVASALSGTLSDVRVSLVGPWSSLKDDRVRPLDDPQLDLRLIREVFAGDSRVSYVEEVAVTAAPAPFRLTLTAGTVLRPDGLRDLVAVADKERVGRVKCLVGTFGDEPAAVLDRTAALARALDTREPGEDLDTAIDESWGLWWADGEGWFADWAEEDASRPPSHLLQRTASLEASIRRLEAREEELRQRITRWNKAGNTARDQAKEWEQAARHWQQASDAWQGSGKAPARRSFAQRVKGRLRRGLGK